MSDEISVRGLEFTEDALILTYVTEPRILDGLPVLTSHSIVAPVDAEPIRPLIEDFRLAVADLARDLFEATAENNTMSLEEFEEAEDDLDLDNDLGMGDEREEASDA